MLKLIIGPRCYGSLAFCITKERLSPCYHPWLTIPQKWSLVRIPRAVETHESWVWCCCPHWLDFSVSVILPEETWPPYCCVKVRSIQPVSYFVCTLTDPKQTHSLSLAITHPFVLTFAIVLMTGELSILCFLKEVITLILITRFRTLTVIA